MSVVLGDDDLRRIFDEEVRPYLEWSRSRTAGVAEVSPRFLSVGGQPGSGKGAVLEGMGESIPGAVTVNGDDLRTFHPDYDRLMKDDPLRMPEATAYASGRWVGMATEYLRAAKISAVVETTLRQPAVLLEEFEAFRRADFRTELRVLAVPLPVSREGTVDRYLRQLEDSGSGRWTPGDHHDAAAAAMPVTVEALVASGLVERVVVQGRHGQVFHDANAAAGGRIPAEQAVDAVAQARNVAALSPEDARTWLARTERHVVDAVRLGVRDPDMWRVMVRLATVDAVEMAATAFPNDARRQRESVAHLASLVESRAPSARSLRRASFPNPARDALEARGLPDAPSRAPESYRGPGRSDGLGFGR